MWMLNSFDITTALVFLLTLCIVYLNTRRSALVPPGPSLWPIVGNILCLRKDPLEALASLRQKYGDVVGLYFGSDLTVFVSGYEAIHEILVKRGTLFSRRPENTFTNIMVSGDGLVMANGQKWKDTRHFTQTTFQKLYFNKQASCIEKMITEEISFFIDKLAKMENPADIGDSISLSLANVMFYALHGYRPGYTDKQLCWYVGSIQKEFKAYRNNRLLCSCFPFLLTLPVDLLGIRTYYRNGIKANAKHFATYCLNNYDTYIEGQENCLVHYLITDLKVMDKKTWEDILNSDRNLWVLLYDIMAAGSDTTAATIKWILLYLIRNPEVQNRTREEIEMVLGETEIPSLNHRQHLPYVEALVLEGLRLGQVAPLGMPHSVASDVQFRGYRIPKNTTILLNLASVSTDPTVFAEPKAFKPERFLSDDGKSVVVPKEFMPFSKGPRSCIGESIARIELFLYMTTLLQKFEFVCPDGETIPEVEGDLGITHSPKPYKVKIIPR